MAKSLIAAAVCLSVLWLAGQLCALEIKDGYKQKDFYFEPPQSNSNRKASTTEIIDNHSTGKRIHHSPSTKEEKGGLQPDSDESARKQGSSPTLPDGIDAWNIKKLLQYVVSYIHTTNQENDNGYEKLSGDKTKHANAKSTSGKSVKAKNEKSKINSSVVSIQKHNNPNQEISSKTDLIDRSDKEDKNKNENEEVDNENDKDTVNDQRKADYLPSQTKSDMDKKVAGNKSATLLSANQAQSNKKNHKGVQSAKLSDKKGDEPKFEVLKLQDKTKKQGILFKSELFEEEFIDDYINKGHQKPPKEKSIKSNPNGKAPSDESLYGKKIKSTNNIITPNSENNSKDQTSLEKSPIGNSFIPADKPLLSIPISQNNNKAIPFKQVPFLKIPDEQIPFQAVPEEYSSFSKPGTQNNENFDRVPHAPKIHVQPLLFTGTDSLQSGNYKYNDQKIFPEATKQANQHAELLPKNILHETNNTHKQNNKIQNIPSRNLPTNAHRLNHHKTKSPVIIRKTEKLNPVNDIPSKPSQKEKEFNVYKISNTNALNSQDKSNMKTVLEQIPNDETKVFKTEQLPHHLPLGKETAVKTSLPEVDRRALLLNGGSNKRVSPSKSNSGTIKTLPPGTDFNDAEQKMPNSRSNNEEFEVSSLLSGAKNHQVDETLVDKESLSSSRQTIEGDSLNVKQSVEDTNEEDECDDDDDEEEEEEEEDVENEEDDDADNDKEEEEGEEEGKEEEEEEEKEEVRKKEEEEEEGEESDEENGQYLNNNDSSDKISSDSFADAKYDENKNSKKISEREEEISSTTARSPQKSSFANEDVFPKPPTTDKTESTTAESSKPAKNFNTLLEYIYKFSKNALLGGIKNQQNKTIETL